MAAIGSEDALWIGLFWRAAGDSQSRFRGQLAGLFVKNLPLNQEDLADMREVKMGIERRTAAPTLTPPSNTPLGRPHGAKHSARKPKSVCI